MSIPDFELNDRNMVIFILGLIALAVIFRIDDPTELVEKIIIALGSLAIGKRL